MKRLMSAKRSRVVGDAARHPLQADVVHREERQVEADERQPEVQLAEPLVVHPAGHLREPVVDAREDREHRAAEEHVVDVRDDEVRVARVDVDRHRARGRCPRGRRSRTSTRKPIANSIGVVKWSSPFPHRRQPGEDLDPGRHRDHHRGDHHRHAQPAGHAGDEHVVRPDREAEDEDREQRRAPSAGSRRSACGSSPR